MTQLRALHQNPPARPAEPLPEEPNEAIVNIHPNRTVQQPPTQPIERQVQPIQQHGTEELLNILNQTLAHIRQNTPSSSSHLH
jgi:hypothetical protein